MLNRSWPAKILLFGEYTILNGSKALAMPYNDFSGKWSFEEKADPTSRQSLLSFLDHSSENYIDLERLKADVAQGLWFDSSIPHGYGLGSSGALIAAIFDAYGNKDPQDKRTALAKLEDHFHGSSSGLDPLVSLIQRPLLIHSFNDVSVLDVPLKLENFFLINTGKPRHTGPLVGIYQEKLKDPQFKQGCAEILSRDVNFAIDAILKNERTHLFHYLWHISKFQWDFFPEMIPTQMRGFWTRGIETGDYVLKLCGAGGGGFLLGYSEKLSADEKRALFHPHELRELK